MRKLTATIKGLINIPRRGMTRNLSRVGFELGTNIGDIIFSSSHHYQLDLDTAKNTNLQFLSKESGKRKLKRKL
jgi:hypothetical protein